MTVIIHQKDGTKRTISGGMQSVSIDLSNEAVVIKADGGLSYVIDNVVTCTVERGWHELEEL